MLATLPTYVLGGASPEVQGNWNWTRSFGETRFIDIEVLFRSRFRVKESMLRPREMAAATVSDVGTETNTLPTAPYRALNLSRAGPNSVKDPNQSPGSIHGDSAPSLILNR